MAFGQGAAAAPFGQDPPPSGAFCLIVRVRIASGSQGAFESGLLALSGQVLKREVGCLSYQLHRQLGSDRDYVIYQRFRSWADYENHGDTPHLRAALLHLEPLFEGAPVIEVLAPLD